MARILEALKLADAKGADRQRRRKSRWVEMRKPRKLTTSRSAAQRSMALKASCLASCHRWTWVPHRPR